MELDQILPNHGGGDTEGRNAFAKALRKIHAAGGQDELAKFFGRPANINEQLRKLATPPEDSDASDKEVADTGAANQWRDPEPSAKAPLFGAPPQRNSITTASSSLDATTQAIKDLQAKAPQSWFPQADVVDRLALTGEQE